LKTTTGVQIPSELAVFVSFREYSREMVRVGEVGFYSTPLTDDTPPSQSVSWQSLPVLWWAYSWNVQTTWWEVQMKSETA